MQLAHLTREENRDLLLEQLLIDLKGDLRILHHRGDLERAESVLLLPPPPRSVPQSQGVVTPVTRQASTASIRSEVLGGLPITAEQASAHVSIVTQHHLVRDRQDYGPLFSTARSSPRALQVGSMMLQLEDDNPPLAPPFGPPERELTVMGEHFADIMQELNAMTDEVASPRAEK